MKKNAFYWLLPLFFFTFSSAESVQWEGIKTVQAGNLNLAIPQQFTSCNLSAIGLDNCFFYFVVNNSAVDFTTQQLRGISINNVWDDPASVSGIKYSFTKNFTIKTAYKTTPQLKLNCTVNNETRLRDCNRTYVNVTRNWTVLDTGAYETGVSTWKKGESVFVKVDFQRTRLKELWFNLSFDIAGIHLFADPVVSACGTLTYAASGGLPFTLGANITTAGTCLIVASDNITIDGMGRYIDGSGCTSCNGIETSGTTNITIKNITIKGFGGAGIYLEVTTNSIVRNANIGQFFSSSGWNQAFGVALFVSSNITVRDSYIHDYGGTEEDYAYGINTLFSDASLFENNRIEDFYDDFCIGSCYSFGIYDAGQNNDITKTNFTNIDSNAGVFLEFPTNSLVSENHFQNCMNGIYDYGSTESLIENNSVNASAGVGIRTEASGLNRIQNNNITNSGSYGIYAISVTSTNMTGNRIENTSCNYLYTSTGVYIASSTDLRLDGNNMTNNCWNFGLLESYMGYRNTILSTNLVQGKRLYYNHSISNYEFNPTTAPDAGLVFALNSTNITVKNLNLSGRSEYGGAVIYATNNSRIENNTISEARHGVYLKFNRNNTIISNRITLKTEVSSYSYGIEIQNSANNSIVNNTVTTETNYHYGIYASTAENSLIENNSVRVYGGTTAALVVSNADNYIVRGNVINATSLTTNGIVIAENVANSTIENNMINTLGTGIITSGGTSYKSFYLNFTNNYIWSRAGSALYLNAHTNYSRVINNTLIGSNALALIAPIIVYAESNSITGTVSLGGSGKGRSNYTFVNTSAATVSWGSNENGNLTLYWYIRANTTYGALPIQAAVNISNKNGAVIYNGISSIVVPSSGGLYNCYQETANETTACGGLSTGTYYDWGSDPSANNWYSGTSQYTRDGSWSTYAQAVGGGQYAYLYINYTKPTNAISAIWSVKTGDTSSGTISNVSATNTQLVSCWNSNTTTLRFRISSTATDGNHINASCYNGTGWYDLYYSTTGRAFYEEAIYWNFAYYTLTPWTTALECTTNRTGGSTAWNFNNHNATGNYFGLWITKMVNITSTQVINLNFLIQEATCNSKIINQSTEAESADSIKINYLLIGLLALVAMVFLIGLTRSTGEKS